MVQRNALSVFGSSNWSDEIDGGDNSFCSSFDMGYKGMNYSSIEYQKPTKPMVRHTKPRSSCTTSSCRGNLHSSSKMREERELVAAAAASPTPSR